MIMRKRKTTSAILSVPTPDPVGVTGWITGDAHPLIRI
jgi:hypothetical protein